MSRIVVSLAVFAAVAVGVCFAAFRGGEALGVSTPEVALDAARVVEAGLVPLRERAAEARAWHVGFLGDSMLVSYPQDKQVPSRLQQALDARAGGSSSIRVYSLASPGMGPFDYYFVAEQVAAASPQQVILPINLTVFSNGWRESFARPELAGFISPSRLPEAFGLPLEWVGLTADRLLGYVAIVQLSGADAWLELMRQQARLGVARNSVRDMFAKHFGSDAEGQFALASYRHLKSHLVIPETRRLTQAGVSDRFGPALAGLPPDDPSLQLLAAAIRVFRSHDIEVLVYTNPTNMESIESVGSTNAAGLARTLASIEEVSKQAGADFVDLHDLLPDAGFRDFAGHLSIKGALDGPLSLASRLAPIVIQSAHRASAVRR